MKAHESGSFGELLKKFRRDPMRWNEKRPTQADLAGLLNVSLDTIQSYEQNKRFPDSGGLEALAKVFKLTEAERGELASALRSTKEARRGGIESDTVQITTDPPGNDEVTTSPPHPTEPTAPSRNTWKLLSKVLFGLVIAALLVFAVYTFIISPRIQSSVKPVLVSGKVLCANNEPVVDIWVDVFKDGKIDKDISGRADLRSPNSNGSEVVFVKVLTGDAYNLHVGCGGSTQHWKGVYTTELGTGPVHDHNAHFFICHDTSSKLDYGPCNLQY